MGFIKIYHFLKVDSLFIKLQVQHRYSEFAALHAQLTVSIKLF